MHRLELRVERLRVTFRFTFAFHAREVRFESDAGEGYGRVFPETFSFHAERHDPTELFLQLDDLLRKPRLLSPLANRRDAVELVTRLLSEAPRYLEQVVERIEAEGRLDQPARLRVHQDVAILAQILLRFIETRELTERRSLRVAGYLLRRRIFRSLSLLLQGRVDPDYVDRYARGEEDPVDPSDDPSESGVFHVLETGEPEIVNRIVVRMAERAFYLWLEGVCLDEENDAFEKEDSPFADRETEVLLAIGAQEGREIWRCDELVPFLRRPSRDCRRLLKKLEAWFLRQYDIHHSSAMIRHGAWIERGVELGRRILTRHGTRNYALMLGLITTPYVAAAFAYERAPLLFDAVCSAQMALILAFTIWFLAYQFCWKRDLTVFYASVPRILAGVIVGYLPVFLIDEVWDLSDRDIATLVSISFLLGTTTLLYIYVEVQRRLGGTRVAFARARSLFMLGVLEAAGVGLLMTSLVGRFMVSRNWSPGSDPLPVETLRHTLEPLLGQLPRIVGLEPFYVFPSAVLMMTFLSFFIGIFLQLMWEDLPITEPL
ncbi:MAG: hypothetical protein O7A09_09690 [Proteobacteria bacterium]|nr:hypothetical protein [Pseudomonadota bacterium]